jgi:hypothetical protein
MKKTLITIKQTHLATPKQQIWMTQDDEASRPPQYVTYFANYSDYSQWV